MESTPASPSRPARVLFVCTANICRSPMAEGLLRAAATSAGLSMLIASAGVEALEGPAAPQAVAVMADRQIDISHHRAHQLVAADIESADLVLTMSRSHGVDVVAATPASFPRTYTLPEFVRRATAAGRPGQQDFTAWLAGVHAGRDRWSLLRGDAADEIDDPYGRGRRSYVRCADRLEGLIADLVALLPPSV